MDSIIEKFIFGCLTIILVIYLSGFFCELILTICGYDIENKNDNVSNNAVVCTENNYCPNCGY